VLGSGTAPEPGRSNELDTRAEQESRAVAIDNSITLVGNLVDDPELRFTQNGVAVANVRVAVNRRMRNKDTNEWEDSLDGYFRVNAWRDLAENVADSLHRGNRVLITGRLISRSYEDREGQTRWVTEVEADEICPSLRWATAKLTKVSRGAAGREREAETSWGGAPPPAAPAADEVPF
jgi:single-strand DNA-binding protein